MTSKKSTVKTKTSALSAKQLRFVEEYLIDLNASQAAIRAGYSKNTATQIGCQNLTKLNIQNAIADAIKARSERVEVNQDEVLRFWAAIMRANLADYVKLDGNSVRIDFTNTTDEQLRNLADITYDEAEAGGVITRKTKLKLKDTLRASEMVGRHLNMFEKDNSSKVEVDLVDHAATARAKLEKSLA